MNIFNQDIIFSICSWYKKNKHIVRLLSVTKKFHLLKYKYHFALEPMRYDVIQHLGYKNSIKNVLLENLIQVEKCFYPTHITFTDGFNSVLPRNYFPSSLTQLAFGRLFNKKLEENTLPVSLQHLKFGFHFNQPLNKNVLPPFLTHLTFGDDFNQLIEPGVLPPRLLHLEFGLSFDKPLYCNALPNTITHLDLGCKFNRPLELGVLPSSLTFLELGPSFTHVLKKGVLPNTLKIFRLVYDRHMKLKPGVLPDSISHMDVFFLGGAFEGRITNFFPKNLVSLKIGGNFDLRVEKGLLPSSIKKLSFYSSIFNQRIEPGELPSSLVKLDFGHAFNRPIGRELLPFGLKKLILGDSFNQPLEALPPSLTHLEVGNTFSFAYITPSTFTNPLEVFAYKRSSVNILFDLARIPSKTKICFH